MLLSFCLYLIYGKCFLRQTAANCLSSSRSQRRSTQGSSWPRPKFFKNQSIHLRSFCAMLIIIPHYGAQNCIYKSGANLTQPSFFPGWLWSVWWSKWVRRPQNVNQVKRGRLLVLCYFIIMKIMIQESVPSKTENLQKRQNCNKWHQRSDWCHLKIPKV